MKVEYCGGCNPHIDRTALAALLPTDDPDVRAEATVYLSGCPRACASHHALTSADPTAVLVAGELVNGVATPASELAATVMRKLKE
jgi:sulfite reductase beta subunit-like hemoprotein